MNATQNNTVSIRTPFNKRERTGDRRVLVNGRWQHVDPQACGDALAAWNRLQPSARHYMNSYYRYHLENETSVPALLNKLAELRGIISDGEFRTREEIQSIVNAHGLPVYQGGNHVAIHSGPLVKGELGGRIGVITMIDPDTAKSIDWPNERPFDVAAGLEVQEQQLRVMEAVYKPEVMVHVIKCLRLANQEVRDPKTGKPIAGKTGNDVTRGHSIDQIVLDIENDARNNPEKYIMRLQVRSFIVLTLGYWGRGKSVAEAAKECRKNGAQKSQAAVVKMIIGDETPEVDRDGYLIHDAGSECYDVLWNVKLGALMAAEPNKSRS